MNNNTNAFNPFSSEVIQEPKPNDCWTKILEWAIRSSENETQAFEIFKEKMISYDWTQEEVQESWDEYFG